jgi:hypothetical protein
MTINYIYKAVPTIKFTALQTYLRNTNWVQIDVPKPHVALFQKNIDNRFFEVLLPLSKHFGDYTHRMVDVLDEISEAEQRDIHLILIDLALIPDDLEGLSIQK